MQHALAFPRHVTHAGADRHVVPNLEAATGLLAVAAIAALGTAFVGEAVVAVKVLVPVVLAGVVLLFREDR